MTHAEPTVPETKAGSAELKEAFNEFLQSFENFRDANDQRLCEIERRASADVLTCQKVDRISTALDEQKAALDRLVRKSLRPPLSPSQIRSEHQRGFDAYLRRGDGGGLVPDETKAMSRGSHADGGYLVPDELEASIARRLSQLSPIRGVASVRQVSGAVLKKPFALTGPAVGWVGDTDARPQTASPTLTELQFPTMELYAMPAATPTLLEDAVVNLDDWITSEIELAFAEQEGAAFVKGDGVNKPRGILSYPLVADANWQWGSVGFLSTGVSGGLPKDNPSDLLIDTIYALKSGYRQQASWVMNRKTQASIRKLKDADGNYLWQPPASPGQPAMLMGFRVVEAEDMPNAAAGVTPIAFGDFSRAYLVVDRAGMRVLRDPYSAKPYVLFYTTKRVGGGIQDFEAVKLIRYA